MTTFTQIMSDIVTTIWGTDAGAKQIKDVLAGLAKAGEFFTTIFKFLEALGS